MFEFGKRKQYRFGLFTCKDGSCVPETYVCDGYIDCQSSDDGIHCKCDKSDLITMALACFTNHDQSKFVKNGIDNKFTETILCRKGSVLTYTVPRTKWCIYEQSPQDRTSKYCPHAEHLKSCKNYICNKYFICPNSYCVPYSYLWMAPGTVLEVMMRHKMSVSHVLGHSDIEIENNMFLLI